MKIKSLFVLLAIFMIACTHANIPNQPAIETSTLFSISSSVGSTLTATIQPTSSAKTSTPTPVFSSTSIPSPAQTSTAVTVIPPPPGIVFRTDHSIWIANNNGNKQLPVDIPTHTDSMKFCSTGKYILAATSQRETTGGWSYSTIEVSTGKQAELDPGKDRTFCSVQWWPVGCDALLANIEPSADIGRDCESFPAIMDLSGNYIFTGSSSQFVNIPQPSSDGKLLAYSQAGRPWIYLWGIGSYPILIDDKVFLGGDFVFFRPTWSPDNKHIAWLVSGLYNKDWMEGVGIIDLKNNTSFLFYPNIAWGGEFPSYLTWNPQQSYIALLPYDHRLRVLNLDGKTSFFVDNVLNYSWSPDGNWLMYRVFADFGVSDVYISSADGAEIHKIGSGSDLFSWSPDSSYAIYTDNTNYMIVQTGVWKPAIIDLPQGAVFVDWIK